MELKNDRGITLIALLISVVVMLILAGVTINLTLGENGIFTTAQKAAQNYTQAQNQELSYLEGFTNEVNNIVNPAPLGTIIRTENNINYTADGAGNTIPVPAGFSPITTEDQGTKDTGFVIKNDIDGNEFVWVPVGNVENYKRVAWTRDDWYYRQTLDTTTGKITRNDLEAETYYWTEEMPQDEYDSVSTYGGFYIGRYEAGLKDAILTSTTSEGTTWTGYTGENIKLVVQKEQQVWNYITRDKAKAVAEDLYDKSTDKVASKLCSSYAWDSALKFIQRKNSTYPTNSTGGNYTITGGTGELRQTGYHSVNNIYDMGGNTSEWTTESCSDTTYPCVNRGSDFNGSAPIFPAAFRGRDSATGVYINIGFRITLFM